MRATKDVIGVCHQLALLPFGNRGPLRKAHIFLFVCTRDGNLGLVRNRGSNLNPTEVTEPDCGSVQGSCPGKNWTDGPVRVSARPKNLRIRSNGPHHDVV
jgi:hypothetical protein